MGLFDNVKNIVAPIDDEEFEEEIEFDDEEMQKINQYEQPKNKSMKVASDAKMVLFEPRSFDEVDEIAVHLKQKKACVVNLHRLQKEYSQRTIDFLSGVVFALDGSIQKIGNNVILCTPRSIGVSGEINLDSLNEEE